MTYRVLTETVVLAHFAFVLFVVVGGLLVLKWPRVAWAHVPAAVWGILVEWSGWVCPLTPLEEWLRVKAGGVSYEGGFIAHYLMPVLYPVGLTRERQLTLSVVVVVVNGLIYWRFMRARVSVWRAGGEELE
jgi:prolipoprotein diacylglyceryltransferase